MPTHKRKAHTRVIETRKGTTNSRKTVQVSRATVKRKKQKKNCKKNLTRIKSLRIFAQNLKNNK